MTTSSHTRVAVLVGSLRADSTNRKVAELLRDRAPEGVVLDLVEGLAEVPFYDEDVDRMSPRDVRRIKPAVRFVSFQ